MQRRLPNVPVQRRSIYFPQWKAFLTGALPLLLSQYPCPMRDNRVRPPLDKSKLIPPDWLRVHQINAFQKMLTTERGIIHHTTAVGKTFLASAWVLTIPVRHLVLIHRKEIFQQFQERFEYFLNEDFDIICGNNTRYKNQRVCLGMIQSVTPRVVKKEIDIKSYQSIVIDESHHAGWQSQYSNVLFPSDAYFRFGLTGTPKREAGDSIVHVGLLGPVLHEYRYRDAVEDGYVTPVNVTVIKNWQCRGGLPGIEPYHLFYKAAIIQNLERNILIRDIAKVLIHSGKSTLILVREIVHEEILLKLIRESLVSDGVNRADAYRWVDLVHGKDKERQQKKEDFEQGLIKCLIATTLYDEGIDIHRIGAIILGAGGRSEREVKQRIGRGQRLDSGKKVLLVFDFTDSFHFQTDRHGKQRLKVYIQEEYHVEGMVANSDIK